MMLSKLIPKALKIVDDVTKWWTKAGYTCQSANALVKKILGLNDQRKNLNKQKKRFESGKRKQTKNFLKQVDFKKVEKHTFWVMTKSYEEYLTEISHGNRMKEKG